MEVVFLDRNRNIIELNEFFYKYPKDEWNELYFIKNRWYRDSVIFKLKIDKDDLIIASRYKICNIDPENIYLKEDIDFTCDEFKSLFDTDIKISKNNCIEIIFNNQKKINIPIEEYIKTIDIFNGYPIKIPLGIYDNKTVISYIRLMKDLNIKKYSFEGCFGINYDIVKYDIINHDTYFTVSEISDCYHLNFELQN